MKKRTERRPHARIVQMMRSSERVLRSSIKSTEGVLGALERQVRHFEKEVQERQSQGTDGVSIGLLVSRVEHLESSLKAIQTVTSAATVGSMHVKLRRVRSIATEALRA